MHPFGYSYSFSVIQFCIALKLCSSVSFRSISKIILSMNLYLNCSYRAPSHATVLLWVKKYGLCQLSRKRQKADDWVVILDESVQFGQNKLLLVYGIRHSDINFFRALNFSDLTPLAIISKSTWSGDAIAGQLELIENEIGKIKYAVADRGNSIKKALKTKGIYHVYDITHGISLIVEHIYKHDPEFKAYTKRMAHLRGAQALGKMSHVLPPAQRSKARFMNLRPVSDWGISVLNVLENGPDTLKAEKINLNWVMGYKEIILELALLNQMINSIQLLLKTKGLSTATLSECGKELLKANTPRLHLFTRNLSDYLHQMWTNRPMKDLNCLLCSSDIIESAFGKYKYYIHTNPMVGITNLSLTLAAFTGKLTLEEMKEAFQSTKVDHVKKWTAENIGQTTMAKRFAVFNWNEKVKLN